MLLAVVVYGWHGYGGQIQHGGGSDGGFGRVEGGRDGVVGTVSDFLIAPSGPPAMPHEDNVAGVFEKVMVLGQLDWASRWVQSEHKGKEFGKFKLTAGKFYGDAEKDKGIQTSQAKRIGEETWGATKDEAKKMKDAQDEEERKKAEEEAKAAEDSKEDDEEEDDDELDEEDDDDIDELGHDEL
ncbi:Calreticulin [Portunus trituberculatus]|uniref:Calreticulin n=1 Tax=Portunus trituberculatus TaxID=210409 RepID=A0A5B7DVY0_PORTR|nr:Calreticulin [Portunus trituberculatus]